MNLEAIFSGTLSKESRILVIAAVILLIPALFLPIWRFNLFAPQYPEGLRMYIHSFTVRGDLHKINILNHYIGMKAIQRKEFPEFRLLPFFILRFILLAGLAALVRRKEIGALGWLDFAVFGMLMLLDLYHWLYTYGHELDPHAPMKIKPFTPPLIGIKQFANFRIIGFPGIGGICMILAAALGPVVLWLDYRKVKKSSN